MWRYKILNFPCKANYLQMHAKAFLHEFRPVFMRVSGKNAFDACKGVFARIKLLKSLQKN